jgi:integrase
MARPHKPWYWAARQAWVVEIEGQRHTLAKGPKPETRAAAVQEFHRLMAQRGQANPAAASIAVKTLSGLFLDHIEADRKPKTYEWYRRHLKSFVAAHGDRQASSIRPHHVADWAGGHGWGPSTRRGAITAVKAAFAWGRKMGHLELDPIKDLDKPTPVRREKIISRAQAKAILGAVPARFGLFLEFLLECGARPGEAAALTKADVDLERGIAVLVEHKTERSTRKSRLIPLSARARQILTDQIGENPAGALFRNDKGNAWTRYAMACAFRRLRAKLGMGKEATAQAMRHRFATDAAKILPNTVVAAILGHKSTAMVDRVYTHIGDEVEVLVEAVDKVRPSGDRPA